MNPSAGRHNLPLFATCFIGRERETAAIRRLLRRSRLVTLCGPGGCGKTRLAIEAAIPQVRLQPDGTWLVDLAPLNDPDLVPEAAASVLGIRAARDQPAMDALATYVADRRLLLVLALSCDLRLAADTLALRIPELALGIPLTWAGLPRLVREIGLPRTRDLVLTGREILAAEALDWGLVTRVASEDRLDSLADGMISSVLKPPSAVTAMTRQSLAAIGRDMMTAAGWADVDVYLGAIAREESAEAGRCYVENLE